MGPALSTARTIIEGAGHGVGYVLSSITNSLRSLTYTYKVFKANEDITTSPYKIEHFNGKYHTMATDINGSMNEIYQKNRENVIYQFNFNLILDLSNNFKKEIKNRNSKNKLDFAILYQIYLKLYCSPETINGQPNINEEQEDEEEEQEDQEEFDLPVPDPIFDGNRLLNNLNQYSDFFSNQKIILDNKIKLIMNNGDGELSLRENMTNIMREVKNLRNNNTNNTIENIKLNYLINNIQNLCNNNELTIRFLLLKLKQLILTFRQNIEVDINYLSKNNRDWGQWAFDTVPGYFVNLARRGMSYATTHSFYTRYRDQVIDGTMLRSVNRQLKRLNENLEILDDIKNTFKNLEYTITESEDDELIFEQNNTPYVINIGNHYYQKNNQHFNDFRKILSNKISERTPNIELIFHGNQPDLYPNMRQFAFVFISDNPFIIKNSSINEYLGLSYQDYESIKKDTYYEIKKIDQTDIDYMSNMTENNEQQKDKNGNIIIHIEKDKNGNNISDENNKPTIMKLVYSRGKDGRIILNGDKKPKKFLKAEKQVVYSNKSLVNEVTNSLKNNKVEINLESIHNQINQWETNLGRLQPIIEETTPNN